MLEMDDGRSDVMKPWRIDCGQSGISFGNAATADHEPFLLPKQNVDF